MSAGVAIMNTRSSLLVQTVQRALDLCALERGLTARDMRRAVALQHEARASYSFGLRSAPSGCSCPHVNREVDLATWREHGCAAHPGEPFRSATQDARAARLLVDRLLAQAGAAS